VQYLQSHCVQETGISRKRLGQVRYSRLTSDCSLPSLILGLRTQFNRLSALRSETYGFRPAALVFSLPRALCLWSLILLMAQAALWTLSLVHPSFFVGTAGLVILVGWGTGHQGISLEDFRHCNMMAANCFGFIQRCGQIMLRRRS
jgi:hypothetical protein